MSVRVTVLQATTVLLAVAYSASFFGTWHFMLDNLTSFQAQFGVAFLLVTLLHLRGRKLRWLVPSAAGMIICAAQLAPWFVPLHPASAAEQGQYVKLVSANVLSSAEAGRRLAGLVVEESPDLFAVIELTPGVAASIAPIRATYPYHLEMPNDDTEGLGLYSRMPLTDMRMMDLGGGTRPVISAVLHADTSPVEILVVHPYAPMTASWTAQRNRQLELLASYVREAGRPVILMGDLNIAMWSSYYREFAVAAGLRNARDGRGIGGTWPALPGLAVPIDHVLGTPDVELEGFRVLDAIGSDHFPIMVQAGLPGQR